MRLVTQIKNQTVASIRTIDKTICHQGGSKARRAGMMIGENNGKSDANTARFPFGLLRTGKSM